MPVKYLNSKEALERLGFKDLDTLYRYVHDGKIRAYKLGDGKSKRRWRFTEKDLDIFIRSNPNA